jgi:hypothetical protein
MPNKLRRFSVWLFRWKWLLVVTVSAVGALLIWLVKTNTSWEGVLVNLATEAIAIAFTVAIVDEVLAVDRAREERARERESRAAQIKWEAREFLYELNTVVYIWLGAPTRKLYVAKLQDRIRRVNPREHRLGGGRHGKGAVEAFLKLGTDASRFINQRPELTTDTRFKNALETLSLMGGLSDDDEATADRAKELAWQALQELKGILEVKAESALEDQERLDASPEEQRKRYISLYGA